jgi:hypothetical protein
MRMGASVRLGYLPQREAVAGGGPPAEERVVEGAGRMHLSSVLRDSAHCRIVTTAPLRF